MCYVAGVTFKMILRKINSEGEDTGNHASILEKASSLVWGHMVQQEEWKTRPKK